MKITNRNNLPQALENAIRDTAYESTKGSYGITTLLKGNLEIILQRKYFNELEQDVSDMSWAFFGTCLHYYLETHNKEDYAEHKFKVSVSNSYVAGVVDLYEIKTNTIWDYKTCAVWKLVHKDFDDWRKQLLGYCWGLEKTEGLKVRTAKICAFMKDWSIREWQRDFSGTYPQQSIEVIEFNFTDEDIETFDKEITEKIKSLEIDLEKADELVSICNEKERWTKPSKYAVMKKGRKSALKVCESEEEAIKYINENGGDTIEVRKGEDSKCDSYCLVRDFCPFYKKKLESVDNGV